MGFSELLREVQEMAQSLRMVAPPIKGEFGDAFLSFVLGKILETFLDCQKNSWSRPSETPSSFMSIIEAGLAIDLLRAHNQWMALAKSMLTMRAA